MKATRLRQARSKRRIRRVRKKILGTPERPRLSVSRSHRNIEAQIIDDMNGVTICAVGSRSKDGKAAGYGGNKKAAEMIGKLIGEKATAAGVTEVAFDRRGARYHGRVKALADAAREAGLKF